MSQSPADGAALALGGRLKGVVSRGVSFSTLTTFRLGGPAAVFVVAEHPDDLDLVAEAASGEGVDVLVLGRGSNLLLSDEGFPGIVVKLGRYFSHIDGSGSSVTAGGGLPFPQAANWAARRGLAGLEFAIAIPGSVGGAVKMNAGAHGNDIATVLDTAQIVSINGGNRVEARPGDLSMSYRRTSLGPDQIVVSAVFRLAESDRRTVTERMEDFRRHRAETQPLEANNAGSMFKNPPGGSAGKLIEQAGLKGAARGGVEVSSKHGNFFTARAGASAQDAYDLMAAVQRTIRDEFGISLEPEVRLVGSFDESNGVVER
ncbi:MAG TPA: UDP-N-acetylmuramate dehydrogenase [Actinomycetota bacterium]|nr:UDP-N-acetylmuramate dehydrogenase [Actinomycetota bacterium]